MSAGNPESVAASRTAARGLHLIPEGGLSNRLRVVASALSFTSTAQLPLRVHWMRTPDFNAGFSQLFETGQLGFELREWGGSRPYKLVERAIESLARLAGVSVWGDAQTHISAFDVARFSEVLGQGRVLMRTNYPLGTAGKALYGRFVPVAPLRALIERQLGDGEAPVGVHVRRGDHVKATQRSTLDGFIQAMQAEVDLKAETRFFVATDDPASLQALQQRFGERVRHYPKRALARNDPRALEDAVVDLYTLARTRKLLGSYWSSFSDMAHDMGGQPYHVVGSDG